MTQAMGAAAQAQMFRHAREPLVGACNTQPQGARTDALADRGPVDGGQRRGRGRGGGGGDRRRHGVCARRGGRPLRGDDVRQLLQAHDAVVAHVHAVVVAGLLRRGAQGFMGVFQGLTGCKEPVRLPPLPPQCDQASSLRMNQVVEGVQPPPPCAQTPRQGLSSEVKHQAGRCMRPAGGEQGSKLCLVHQDGATLVAPGLRHLKGATWKPARATP